MAVLQRVKLVGNQRLDLPDFLNAENFANADWLQFFEKFVSDSAYIAYGFSLVDAPGHILHTPTVSVSIANGALFNPVSLGVKAGFFVASSTEPDQSIDLTVGATNYIELDYSESNAGTDIRRIWDQSANGGAGSEFAQTVDTATILTVVATANTAGFTEGKVPVAKVVVSSGSAPTIQSITDCRPLLFRLGTGGNNPNPSHTFPWPDLPSSTYAKQDTPITITSPSDPDPFSGSDKNIRNLKDWMDAVTTRIKELAGSSAWFSEGGRLTGTNLADLWWDSTDSQITGTGRFQVDHGTTAATKLKLKWTSKLIVQSAAGKYAFEIAASAVDEIADGEVLYLTQTRNQPLPSEASLSFTNGALYINGSPGAFTGLDTTNKQFLKKESDGYDKYVKISAFKSGADGGGGAATPTTAASVTIESNYTGTSEFATGVYANSVYTVTKAAKALVSSNSDMFWIARREDNGGTPRIYIRGQNGALKLGDSRDISNTKDGLDSILKPVIHPTTPDTSIYIYPSQKVSGGKRRYLFLNDSGGSSLFPFTAGPTYDGSSDTTDPTKEDDRLTEVRFTVNAPNIEVTAFYPDGSNSGVLATGTFNPGGAGGYTPVLIYIDPTVDLIRVLAGATQLTPQAASTDVILNGLAIAPSNGYPIAIAIVKTSAGPILNSFTDDLLIDRRPFGGGGGGGGGASTSAIRAGKVDVGDFGGGGPYTKTVPIGITFTDPLVPTWDTLVTYGNNDRVVYLHIQYFSTSDPNLGLQPDTNPGDWTPEPYDYDVTLGATTNTDSPAAPFSMVVLNKHDNTFDISIDGLTDLLSVDWHLIKNTPNAALIITPSIYAGVGIEITNNTTVSVIESAKLKIGLEFDGRHGTVTSGTDALAKFINQGGIINAASLTTTDLDLGNFPDGQGIFPGRAYVMGSPGVLAFPGNFGNNYQGSLSIWAKNLADGDYIAYNPLLGIEVYRNMASQLEAKITQRTDDGAGAKKTTNTTLTCTANTLTANYDNAILTWNLNDGASSDLSLYRSGTDSVSAGAGTYNINAGDGGVWFFGSKRNDPTWTVYYSADAVPDSVVGDVWALSAAAAGTASISDGVLTISTTGSQQRSYNRTGASFNFNTVNGVTVEWKMQVTTALRSLLVDNRLGIRFGDGGGNKSVAFYYSNKSISIVGGYATGSPHLIADIFLDTTQYHIYRATLLNGAVNLYIDGVMVFTGNNTAHTTDATLATDTIEFGDFSVISGTSASDWEYVKYYLASGAGDIFVPITPSTQGHLDSIGVASGNLSTNEISLLQANPVTKVFNEEPSYGPTLPLVVLKDRNGTTTKNSETFTQIANMATYLYGDGITEYAIFGQVDYWAQGPGGVAVAIDVNGDINGTSAKTVTATSADSPGFESIIYPFPTERVNAGSTGNLAEHTPSTIRTIKLPVGLNTIQLVAAATANNGAFADITEIYHDKNNLDFWIKSTKKL
jgi:hypothetical protein